MYQILPTNFYFVGQGSCTLQLLSIFKSFGLDFTHGALFLIQTSGKLCQQRWDNFTCFQSQSVVESKLISIIPWGVICLIQRVSSLRFLQMLANAICSRSQNNFKKLLMIKNAEFCFVFFSHSATDLFDSSDWTVVISATRDLLIKAIQTKHVVWWCCEEAWDHELLSSFL